MSELTQIRKDLDDQGKQLHEIKHEVAQFPKQISGMYKNQEVMEGQLSRIISTLDTLVLKIDGNEELGYKGLRKQVEYLTTRDQWLRKKWVQATGAVGGIAIIYGLFRTIDFIIDFFHKIK